MKQRAVVSSCGSLNRKTIAALMKMADLISKKMSGREVVQSINVDALRASYRAACLGVDLPHQQAIRDLFEPL
jgi:hypothetical protein